MTLPSSEPKADNSPAARRIRLTALQPEDCQPLYEWINDRELVLFNDDFKPVTWADHLAWFERVQQRTDALIFAIRPLEGDRLLGTCQLVGLAPVARQAELRIRLGADDARDRGIGTEAVRQLVAYAFDALALERVSLRVFATNARAIRCYEKCGFHPQGLQPKAAFVDGRHLDVVPMAILKDEVPRF